MQWDQKEHANDWLLYPNNIGAYLSIDETAFTNGDLYTILTNKSAKGKKGSLVAMVKGTKSEDVLKIIYKIPYENRKLVKEITLDLAQSMKLIVKKAFPKASKVIDRFHVQKLAFEAVQEVRIRHRWQAIDNENIAIQESRDSGVKYKPDIYNNGETPKQLLARSRYLLYKNENRWSETQKKRAEILFEMYPDIEQAYKLSQKLSWIYENTDNKTIALSRLAKWHEEVRQAKFKTFNIVSKTIELNYNNIINYFNNRSTNASAESFNAKIKGFRTQLKGVRKVDFFMYRLQKLWA
jgi:transposase